MSVTEPRGPLVGDRSGATVVEFALVLPVLMAVILVVLEFGMMLTAQGLLDSAALQVSRLGTTGFAPDGSSREDYIRQFVSSQAFGLLQPEKLSISATSYTSFSDIDQPDKGVPGFGGPDAVVVYRLTYPWDGVTPLIGKFFGDAGMSLTASLAVRNEPFGTIN